VVENADVET